MKKKQAKAMAQELHMIAYWLMKIEQRLDPDYGKTVEFRRFVPLPKIRPLAEGDEHPGYNKITEEVVKGPESVDEFMKLQEEK